MTAIHAIATANPQRLRWVVRLGNRPPGGTVRQAPGRLGGWLDRAVINEIVVRGADVLITLSPANSWHEIGEEIQDALEQALQDPAGWRVDVPTDRNAGLAEAARELLDGQIGAAAKSHGGSIELVSVNGNSVTVRTSGSCDGCPAASSTLYQKLQHELRRRVGDQVTVSRENDSPPLSLGNKLRLNFQMRPG